MKLFVLLLLLVQIVGYVSSCYDYSAEICSFSKYVMVSYNPITAQNMDSLYVNGSVSVVQGFSVSTLYSSNGVVHNGDNVSYAMYNTVASLYTKLAACTCTSNVPQTMGSGITLTAGVYCFFDGFNGGSGVLTLSGKGYFIMLLKSNLNSGFSMNFVNGASYDRLFWLVEKGSSVNGITYGTIISKGVINMNSATLYGALINLSTSAINLNNGKFKYVDTCSVNVVNSTVFNSTNVYHSLNTTTINSTIYTNTTFNNNYTIHNNTTQNNISFMNNTGFDPNTTVLNNTTHSNTSLHFNQSQNNVTTGNYSVVSNNTHDVTKNNTLTNNTLITNSTFTNVNISTNSSVFSNMTTQNPTPQPPNIDIFPYYVSGSARHTNISNVCTSHWMANTLHDFTTSIYKLYCISCNILDAPLYITNTTKLSLSHGCKNITLGLKIHDKNSTISLC